VSITTLVFVFERERTGGRGRVQIEQSGGAGKPHPIQGAISGSEVMTWIPENIKVSGLIRLVI
jgi:hypothetical protein